MIRLLQTRRLGAYLMSSSDSMQTTSLDKYLVFPTAHPVVPYYFHSARINRHLYNYLQKHKIKHVAAFPVRPGVYPRPFYPLSAEDLES